MATTFAKGLGDLEGVEVDAAAVDTNIVRFGLKIASAAKFVEESPPRSLDVAYWASSSAIGLYFDISATDVQSALALVAKCLSIPERQAAPSFVCP